MDRVSLDFLSSHRGLWLLLAPLAIALAIWVYYGTIAPLERPTRTILRALRALAFLVVLFALAEPVLTLVLPEPGKPGLAVLVDHSASMRLPGDDAGTGTRADEGASIERSIVDRLHTRFRLDRFRFATGLDREEGDPGATPGSAGTPDGNTAIGDALEALASRQGSRPVGGVILLSDGTSTVGSDPVGAARDLGIPVFPVRIGPALPPPDARILEVRANPVAYSGEPASVEVDVASSGLAGRSLELRVEDQGRLLASRPVLIGGGDEIEQAVRLDVRPVGVGLRRWDVRLADTKDAIPENDARSVAVRVLERKTRVLYLEGRLDWDFAFLRRTFAADSTFSYRFLVADRTGRWLPDRAGVPVSGPGDLRDYAAVILGEVPPAALPAGFYGELARYVSQGGGLLVLGGRAGLSRLRSTGIETALPAEAIPTGPGKDRPIGVRLEAQGLTHPLTAIEDSPGRSESDWAALPPVWPSPDRLRPRPGSAVLLGFTVPGGTEPALVCGFSGDGKVVALAAHDFWRWDFLPRTATGGIDPFPEFALRTVRWLAEPAARERFTAEPTHGVFENGERPEFTGRVWNESYAPVLDAQVHLSIFSADGAGTPPATQIREFDLRAHGADGTYTAQTDPLAPGAYRFVAEARASGEGALGRVESSFWVDRNGPEYVRLRPDAGTSDQIARASGGEATDRAGLEALLDRIPSVVRRVGRVREIDLWNHLILFLSFVAILSIEWWLRRRSGLA